MGKKSPAEIERKLGDIIPRQWHRLPEVLLLRAIIGWGCASVAGAVGWWLGDKVNLGLALILGVVASSVGLYYGYKWFDNNLG
jgi:hypothetical protein